MLELFEGWYNVTHHVDNTVVVPSDEILTCSLLSMKICLELITAEIFEDRLDYTEREFVTDHLRSYVIMLDHQKWPAEELRKDIEEAILEMKEQQERDEEMFVRFLCGY